MVFSCPKQKLATACGPLQRIGKEVSGKNIEIDLLQENCNKDIKDGIKQWVLTKQTGQLIGLVEPLGVKDSLSKTLTIRLVKQTLPHHVATNHFQSFFNSRKN